MITRAALQARRDQLAAQHAEMVEADQAEHERMVGQINACGGAVQLCDVLLAEIDAAGAAGNEGAATAAKPEGETTDGR